MSQQVGQHPEKTTLGIIVIVLTVFLMSFTDALVKYVSSDFPLWQIYVVRSLIAIPLLVSILLFSGESAMVRPKSMGWTFLRSILLAFMYIAIYAAAPVLSLSVIAAALYAAPLFIALFSALLIGESVGLRGWVGISIGLIGVLVILRPGTDLFSFLTLIPIIAALFYALAAIITRTKCRDETPLVLALALNFSLLTVGIVATIAIILWQPTISESAVYPFLLGYWVTMGPREWGIIALLAILIVAIGIGLAKAYQSGPPTIIATFDYTYLVFAVIWSFIIFSEVPDTATIIGMVLITGAGILVVRSPNAYDSLESIEAT